MNAKEKMLAGLLYNPNFEELNQERSRSKELCFAYNALPADSLEKRREILTKLLGKTGKSFEIQPSFWCDYGYNIELGENFFSNHNLVILDCARVTFGDNCLVAPNCGFYTAGHPLDAEQRNSGLEFALPITVGNNVWIGGNVVVLPGVTIGDNTVIGAGSVVTKDLPSGVIAAGNPCKVIRTVPE